MVIVFKELDMRLRNSINYIKKILGAIINENRGPVVGIKKTDTRVGVYPINIPNELRGQVDAIINGLAAFTHHGQPEHWEIDRAEFEENRILEQMDAALNPLGVNIFVRQQTAQVAPQAPQATVVAPDAVEGQAVPINIRHFMHTYTPNGKNIQITVNRIQFSLPPAATNNPEIIAKLTGMFDKFQKTANYKDRVTYYDHATNSSGADGFVFFPSAANNTIDKQKRIIFPYSTLKAYLHLNGFELGPWPTTVGLSDKAVESGKSPEEEARLLKEMEELGGTNVVMIQRNAGTGSNKDIFIITFPVRKSQDPEFFESILSGKGVRMRSLVQLNPDSDKSVLTYKIDTVLQLIELVRQSRPKWEIDTAVLDEAQAQYEVQLEQFKETKPEIKDKLQPPFNLKAHQNEAVAFMDKTNGNCFIGDDTGTGKTLTAIAWNVSRGNKVLIVTKNAGIFEWISDVRTFFPGYFNMAAETRYEADSSLAALNGTSVGEVNARDFGASPVTRNENLSRMLQNKKLVLMPYHLLSRGWKLTDAEYQEEIQKYMQKEGVDEFQAKKKVKQFGPGRWRMEVLKQAGFNAVVFDESATMRRSGIHTSAVAEEVSVWPGMDHRICQSGTPVYNKVNDWLQQLKLIVTPEDYEDVSAQIRARATDPAKLENFLHKYMIARSKAVLLPYLPKKTSQNVDIAMEDVSDIPMPTSLGGYSKTKKKIAVDKATSTAQFCEEKLQDTDESMLVYSDSPEAATKIFEYLNGDKRPTGAPTPAPLQGKVLKYLGTVDRRFNSTFSMTPEEKKRAREQFADLSKDFRVMVISRTAMADSTNLQKASIVVFNDIPWSPAQIKQAEDRTERMGQDNEVKAYWLSARDVIWDQYISGVVRKKYIKNKALSVDQENVGMTLQEISEAIDNGDSKILLEKLKLQPEEIAFLEKPIPNEKLITNILEKLEAIRLQRNEEAKKAGITLDEEKLEEELAQMAENLIVEQTPQQVEEARATYHRLRILYASRQRVRYELR
jgi:arsenate reductase-like glutaredoxin family protein